MRRLAKTSAPALSLSTARSQGTKPLSYECTKALCTQLTTIGLSCWVVLLCSSYSDTKPLFGCDNKGIIHHGNHPRRPMPEKQQQADILYYYKHLVRDAPFRCKMFHMYGHLDQLLA
ncbi:hypothetical protein ACHAWX_005318 [Stephanocyclus meneghinianus]